MNTLDTNEWTHPICDQCWYAINPKRKPVRLEEAERQRERCCWCGNMTMSGIYRREDPWELPKHTQHKELGKDDVAATHRGALQPS